MAVTNAQLLALSGYMVNQLNNRFNTVSANIASVSGYFQQKGNSYITISQLTSLSGYFENKISPVPVPTPVPTPTPTPTPVPTPTPTPTPMPVPPVTTGFTVRPTDSSYAKVIYVSNSTGNDSNTGLSTSSPVATISRARALAGTGKPVWILFKSGDTWDEGGGFGKWMWSGLSVSQPSILGSYGTGARPIIKCGANNGLESFGGTGIPAGGVDYYWITGVDFYAHTRDPSSPNYVASGAGNGLFLLHGGTGILIEDNIFRFFHNNLTIQGIDNQYNNLTIRRNIIRNAFSFDLNAHSQGIYLDTAYGNILIEENVFYRNGWNPTPAGAKPTMFNHNMYIQNVNAQAIIRNNISCDASSHGIMQRPGGICSGNLVVNCPISISIGNTYGTNSGNSSVTDNCILYGTNITMDGQPALAWGIVVDPSNTSTVVTGNRVLFDTCSGTNVEAIELNGPNNTVSGNIVYNWRGGIVNNGSSTIEAGQVVSVASLLVDASRTIETYMTSIGQTSTVLAFMNAAMNRAGGTWDVNYTADTFNKYMFTGFTKK